MIGAYASDHYDNAEIDGTPNAWQNNKLVTILYLNDNYEGGNLTFNEHNLALAPKQGTLVIFDVGVSNLHGVSEIISGVRYTMLSSWDWADSVYPEGYLKSLLQGRDEEKEKQDQQKKE
jgi:predicted 2-oxoglutarate/Fe(II)-dependent dioxygenase YbiX